MDFIKKWLFRPTAVTSGAVLMLIIAAGFLHPMAQAVAAPSTAKTTIVVTVTPTAANGFKPGKKATPVPSGPKSSPTQPPSPTQTPTPTQPPTPTATAVPTGTLTMYPSGVAFSSCSTGKWPTITLSNTGQASLNWYAQASPSGTALSNIKLSVTSGTLAPGASVTIQVSGTYTPPTPTPAPTAAPTTTPTTKTSAAPAASGTNLISIYTSYTTAGQTKSGPFVTEICQ